MNALTINGAAGRVITLAHGGGGRKMQELIKSLFLPAFANELLSPLSDSAVGEFDGCKIAITTDAFVVSPIEFPGGDICHRNQ